MASQASSTLAQGAPLPLPAPRCCLCSHWHPATTCLGTCPTPPQRPRRAVANLWDPITNQSTPGQEKLSLGTCLLAHQTLQQHVTSSHPLTPGQGGQGSHCSQCSPWEFKPSNKALGGLKPCSCWGRRNTQDVLHRGEAILVLRRSQGCLHLPGRVQPPSLLSFPHLSAGCAVLANPDLT